MYAHDASKLHDSPTGEDAWDVGCQVFHFVANFCHFLSPSFPFLANFPFCASTFHFVCQLSILNLLQAAAGQCNCRHVLHEGEDVWDANFPFCRQLSILCAISLALLALRCWPCAVGLAVTKHAGMHVLRLRVYNTVQRTGYCCRSSSSRQPFHFAMASCCVVLLVLPPQSMHSYMYCAVMCAIGTQSFEALRASLFVAHSSDQLGQVLMHCSQS